MEIEDTFDNEVSASFDDFNHPEQDYYDILFDDDGHGIQYWLS